MSADRFSAITAAFHEAKLPYHSFALKDEKDLKVVLKGDNRKISIEDLRVNRMRKSQKNLNMVVVEVPRKEQKIYSVSRVCGLIVKLDQLRRLAPNQPQWMPAMVLTGDKRRCR